MTRKRKHDDEPDVKFESLSLFGKFLIDESEGFIRKVSVSFSI